MVVFLKVLRTGFLESNTFKKALAIKGYALAIRKASRFSLEN